MYIMGLNETSARHELYESFFHDELNLSFINRKITIAELKCERGKENKIKNNGH